MRSLHRLSAEKPHVNNLPLKESTDDDPMNFHDAKTQQFPLTRWQLTTYFLGTHIMWRSLSKIRGTRCYQKAELDSFPTIYGTPMLLYIGVSYTVGKLSSPGFQLTLRKLGDTNVYSCTRNGRHYSLCVNLYWPLILGFCLFFAHF